MYVPIKTVIFHKNRRNINLWHCYSNDVLLQKVVDSENETLFFSGSLSINNYYLEIDTIAYSSYVL